MKGYIYGIIACLVAVVCRKVFDLSFWVALLIAMLVGGLIVTIPAFINAKKEIDENPES